MFFCIQILKSHLKNTTTTEAAKKEFFFNGRALKGGGGRPARRPLRKITLNYKKRSSDGHKAQGAEVLIGRKLTTKNAASLREAAKKVIFLVIRPLKPVPPPLLRPL